MHLPYTALQALDSEIKNERAKEVVCLYVSNKWKNCNREYGSAGSRIVWVRMKVDIQS